jgi:hypothetical protein
MLYSSLLLTEFTIFFFRNEILMLGARSQRCDTVLQIDWQV